MLRWTRNWGWLALAVAAVCALGLTELVLTTSLEKGTSGWAKAFLVIVGVAAVGSALVVADDLPRPGSRLRTLLRPRPIAGLFLAIFAAFGVMTDSLSLFEPRPAIESEPHAIENAVRRLEARARPATPVPARIRTRIAGLWGEPGCAVAYRFAVTGAALTVAAERRPPGAPPFRMTATITAAAGDTMSVTGEEPAAARGRAAEFTYLSNGMIERLRWNDRSGAVPLDLDRCVPA